MEILQSHCLQTTMSTAMLKVLTFVLESRIHENGTIWKIHNIERGASSSRNVLLQN